MTDDAKREMPWLSEGREAEVKFNDNLSYWMVSGRTISNALVPMAYEDMRVEQARVVRDELERAIEWVEDTDD